jgi:hypothetical protein
LYNKLLTNPYFIKAMKSIKKLEKNRIFCCHGLEHSLDVARIAYIVSLEKGLDISKNLIYSTAILHDIGRSVNGECHNMYSVELAEKILEECGYSDEDKKEILLAIRDHRKSVDKLNNLSDVIKYADKISRCCFDCQAYDECYWNEDRKNKNIKY